MTRDDLNSAIGEAQEQYVAQARETPVRPWRRWVAAAACVAVLAAGGALLWQNDSPAAQGDDPPPSGPAATDGTGDWPVVFNELSAERETRLENGLAILDTAITAEESAQVLPEEWPAELPAYLWGTVGRYGWGNVAEVCLCFLSSDWMTGLIDVRLRPEESIFYDTSVPEEPYVPTHVEGREVMLYRFRPRTGGEYLYAVFNCCGIEYSVSAHVLSDQNETVAEDDFFRMVVRLIRTAREIDFSGWVRVETSATRR